MRKFSRIICVIVIMSLILAVPVSAEVEVQPKGSAFFVAHDTFLYKTTATKFQIWFDVTANGTMQELGVCTIEVERSYDGRNWDLMRIYDMEDYPQMIDTNTGSHTGYVLYNLATSGCYYRACITFYAKNSSGIGKLFRYTAVMQM